MRKRFTNAVFHSVSAAFTHTMTDIQALKCLKPWSSSSDQVNIDTLTKGTTRNNLCTMEAMHARIDVENNNLHVHNRVRPVQGKAFVGNEYIIKLACGFIVLFVLFQYTYDQSAYNIQRTTGQCGRMSQQYVCRNANCCSYVFTLPDCGIGEECKKEVQPPTLTDLMESFKQLNHQIALQNKQILDLQRMIRNLSNDFVNKSSHLPNQDFQEVANGHTTENTRAVLILNDYWDCTDGGLSSVNRQIAFMAKQTGVEVYATALSASDDDKKDAEKNGITLIVADKKGKQPNMSWFNMYHRTHFPSLCKLNISVIIAHIPYTGSEAAQLKKKCFRNSKLFSFLHVIPEDTLIDAENWNSKLLENKQDEIKCQAVASDAVFSIGPRIFHHFNHDFQLSNIQHEQFLLFPDDGFLRLQTMRPPQEQTLKVLTVGRTGHLNGYNLVAAALSEVADIYDKTNKKRISWTVLGISNGNTRCWQGVIQNATSKYLDVKRYPYGTQNRMQERLQQSHLFIMPSRSEPFGLIGLEAIAAGVPTLVTINSGIAQLVEMEFPNIAEEVVVKIGVNNNGEKGDVEEWQKKIINVLTDQERYDIAYDRAQELKERLQQSGTILSSQSRFRELLLD
ncbi:uncharacterized protein LOC144356556 [Saccoglossus kowalevskii]